MRLWAHGGTGPLPHPATQCDYPMGGRVGERAGAASEIALPRFLKRTLDQPAWAGSRLRKTNAASSTTAPRANRSEEHTSELQSLMRISYAVFCLKKKTHKKQVRSTEKSCTS